MREKISILILLNVICISLWGQRNISGIYSTIYKDIIICNDSLKLITPDSPGIPGWILAECTFKWINNDFIEINSTPPFMLVKKGIRIKQSMDTRIIDSIKLVFYIPNYKEKLDISISGSVRNRLKSYNLSYSEKNETLMLPNDIEFISISISNPVYDGELDGSYYGFRYCSIFSEYEIKKDINKIYIEIPAIDDSFFEKYYVKGDYAKVSKDSITWKGEVFVKKK